MFENCQIVKKEAINASFFFEFGGKQVEDLENMLFGKFGSFTIYQKFSNKLQSMFENCQIVKKEAINASFFFEFGGKQAEDLENMPFGKFSSFTIYQKFSNKLQSVFENCQIVKKEAVSASFFFEFGGKQAEDLENMPFGKFGSFTIYQKFSNKLQSMFENCQIVKKEAVSASFFFGFGGKQAEDLENMPFGKFSNFTIYQKFSNKL